MFTLNPANIVDCTTNPTILNSKMHDKLQKILITCYLQNYMVFEVLPKMLQVVYQSDLNKLCQSNIKEYNGII